MPTAEKRPFRRFLVLIIILLSISAVSIFVIQYFKGDRIKQLLVTELNKHLAVEVSVGAVDISVLRSFPFASLILTNTSMKPPKSLPEAPGLIHAESISFKFNLINLLTGKYTIRSIQIQNASLTIYEDEHGNNNFNIWKKESGSKNESVNFNIQRLTLTSSKIYYRNLKRNDDIVIAVNDLVLRGSMQQEQFLLRVTGDCFNERFLIGGENIISPASALFKSEVEINTRKEELDFQRASLTYSDIQIQFNGKYSYCSEPYIDFSITSLNSKISRILTVVPETMSKEFKVYNPEGEITMSGSLKGSANELSTIKISALLELSKGRIDYTQKKISLTDLEAKGSFYYGGKHNSEVLNLKHFKGKVKTGKFSGNTTIRNFSNPAVNLEISIQTNLSEFSSFLENEYLSDFKGNLIADIKYNGTYKKGTRLDKQTTGQATFTDIGFDYNHMPISNINGSVEFRDNKMYFDGLTCNVGSSDIKANGFIDNLNSYIFNEQKNVHASLNLFSDKLVLEDILGLVIKQKSTNKATGMFPPNLSFNAVMSVNSLTYKKLITQNISGNFNLSEEILRGTRISINALGGRITADGLINGRYGNKAQIVTKADFKGVDITQLFYQFNEFGQNSLVSSNLKGKADASVNFATSLFSDFSVNTESAEAIADIEIRNGELNNFEPLQALSRFLDAKELKNIRFETLKNRIEISHKTVLIPSMQIKSSALDLAGYGTHTFGNDINYHVNMLLSDVIRAKQKNKKVSEQSVEDDGYGKPRLFLKLTGPIDNPLVQYDTRAVKNKIVDDFKNEKQVFKDVIQKEFGKKKSITKPETGTSTKKESTEFGIEWDEIK